MPTTFLQEIDATVVLVDVCQFEKLAQNISPVELGLSLTRFYEHISTAVEKNQGRVVKFIGDGVLSVFLGGGSVEHRTRALLSVADMVRTRQGFLDDCASRKMPVLDYVASAASGSCLVGEIGTDKLSFYDVLGDPVNRAFRINGVSTRRGSSNLVDATTYEGADGKKRPSGVETDVVEMGTERIRLFKIEA